MLFVLHFLIDFDDPQIFGHFFDIDGNSLAINQFFGDGLNVLNLIVEFNFIVVVGEHGVWPDEILPIPSKHNDTPIITHRFMVFLFDLLHLIKLAFHSGSDETVDSIFLFALGLLLFDPLIKLHHS